MPLRYANGEIVIRGDHVLYIGEEGVVEVVADPENPTSESDWYIQEFGGGILIAELKCLGRVFTELDDHVEFVRRGDSTS